MMQVRQIAGMRGLVANPRGDMIPRPIKSNFRRVRYATEEFRETGGRAGWNTDRGEVYIVLGQPDNAVERYVGDIDVTRQPNAEEWVYTAVPGGRLNLLFYDRTGFGRYELIPSSASAFRSVAERIKPRSERN
jgi:hypothetical protein